MALPVITIMDALSLLRASLTIITTIGVAALTLHYPGNVAIALALVMMTVIAQQHHIAHTVARRATTGSIAQPLPPDLNVTPGTSFATTVRESAIMPVTAPGFPRETLRA